MSLSPPSEIHGQIHAITFLGSNMPRTSARAQLEYNVALSDLLDPLENIIKHIARRDFLSLVFSCNNSGRNHDVLRRGRMSAIWQTSNSIELFCIAFSFERRNMFAYVLFHLLLFGIDGFWISVSMAAQLCIFDNRYNNLQRSALLMYQIVT